MRGWMVGLTLCAMVACAPTPEETTSIREEAPGMLIASDIGERSAKFAATELTADLSTLTEEERQVLASLVEAGRLMDEVFLRQVAQGNDKLKEEVKGMSGPQAEYAKAYFGINFGPWDRLEEFEPFMGETPHPKGAGYYPADLSAEEFETWLKEHPEDEESFKSLTTVIHRRDGGLVAVPYSVEYRQWLEPAAELLKKAAATTTNDSLKRFLELRAEAFLSDDYYESDLAWMDIDSPVEVTIGPYEIYEDALFGYKAAFEAFVTVDIPEESAALARYKAKLPWLESNLPIPDEHKNPNRGTESPIRVVDLVFSAGDGKAGVQPIAFNLPNDERVREAKGSKKVLLRNTMRAKYDQILVPIAERVLPPDQISDVSFKAFLEEVLHHELAHGLGPGKIKLDGRDTEVRLELKELYSASEEAKATVIGVYNILALIEQGEMPAELRKSLEPTYVAGLFRGARFGLHEAHGQGVVSQFNYLLEKGALEVDEEGRFRAVSEKFPGAIRDIAHDLLMLQAKGDYAGTKAFLDKYGKATPELERAVERLQDVPVDVKPVFNPAAA